MKKVVLLVMLFAVSAVSFAADKTETKSSADNLSFEKTTKPAPVFCTYTVDFHLSCGDFIGACYTCDGCSQAQIDYDLNYYWGQYQNQFCGAGYQGLNPWDLY